MSVQYNAPSVASAIPRLSGVSTFDEATRLVLDYLQQQVPMEFWTVSRVIDGRQVYLDVTPNDLDLAVGDGPAWQDSLCHSMWEHGGPRVAPDVSRVRQYADNSAARALSVASYVGIPLFNSDNTLFGTVCGIDSEVRADSFTEHTPLLELLGQMLSVVRNLDDQAMWLSRQLEATVQEAETDLLTGLRNRRAWRRACELEEARHHRLGDHASIIMLDLDGLKEVNDREGHAAGDAMLRLAAEVIGSGCRRTDVVARLGGDEFAVLCPQTTADEVAPVAQRLRSDLTEAGLSAGIGWATLDQVGTMAGTEAAADAAMYTDKRGRR
ncbi:diguanylate cyclase (GGDEF)-like protein [Nocardioides sp. BE266]|uniref:sensor domain-containing diguanylate cyclase n=1 Tax=Nocardioides sp. BE266 TaxID=2817725 RepID=UPI002857AE78|nr:sensor domain-containing diguanylate cyclase [Nocardioides sp. BE266]MDR7251182.1 diguanylate cyclase (GGDEF)-like protein [Nocardioides sp. BE266]